jgi:hypothetical protein
MMINRIRYVQNPYTAIIPGRYVSKWRIRSIIEDGSISGYFGCGKR